MSDANITITGNLTSDPEITTLSTGTQKATFGVAVAHRYRKGDEWVEDTSFFNVIAWAKLAEDVERILEKGLGVVIEGRLAQRSWETDEGAKRSTVELVADKIAVNIRRLESIERKVFASASAPAQSSSEDELW